MIVACSVCGVSMETEDDDRDVCNDCIMDQIDQDGEGEDDAD